MEINIVTVCSDPTVLGRISFLAALVLPFAAAVVLRFQYKRPDRGFWGSSTPYLVALVPAAFTLGIAWLELAGAERAVALSGAGAIFAAVALGELVRPATLGAATSVVLVIGVAVVNHLRSRHSSVGRNIAGCRVPIGAALFFGLVTLSLVRLGLDLVGRAPATSGIQVHLAISAICILASVALLGWSPVASRVARAKAGSSAVVAAIMVLVLAANGAVLYELSRQMFGLVSGV